MEKLKQGDEILLISTARKVSSNELTICIKTLESWGLNVTLGKNIFKKENQFAGSDELRRADLQWALDHPSANAILCTRGGYGTSRIIDDIDFSRFQQNPKWLIGFSDITILHQHINALGFPSIHGTMSLLFNNVISIESLRQSLFEEKYEIIIPDSPFNKTGNIQGEVVGGNLTLLIHGLGTSSEINTEDRILFIEEIDEYLYHIDRMILQLKRADKLSKLKGLLVGGFTQPNDNSIPFGKSAYEIIASHIDEYGYPVYYNIPAGHVNENWAIIFGHSCCLTSQKIIF